MANKNILKTRVALKIDSLDNWQKSTTPLLNGEAAVSYEVDEVTGAKKHIQIKIGTYDPYGNLQLWKDIPYIDISLTDYNILEIKTALSAYLDEIHSLRNDVNDAKSDIASLQNKCIELQQRTINTDNIPFGSLGWHLNCGTAESAMVFR